MMILILLVASVFALYYVYTRSIYRGVINTNTVFIEIFRLIESTGVDASHDMNHIIEVLDHAKIAINSLPKGKKLTSKQKTIIELACLLHDVDDSKYFDTKNYQNARNILDKTFRHLTDDVIECIGIVSASENGNEIDPDIPSWMYIPRYADRLEAMGARGIERTLTYNAHKKTPTHLPTTIRATTRNELENTIKDRFAAYQNGKKSESVIDHFYDKLLHLKVQTGIPYIDIEMSIRHELMVDYVLNYWSLNSS